VTNIGKAVLLVGAVAVALGAYLALSPVKFGPIPCGSLLAPKGVGFQCDDPRAERASKAYPLLVVGGVLVVMGPLLFRQTSGS
jgi:hypothetical protein